MTARNKAAKSGSSPASCSPWLSWNDRRRKEAYGGTWEVRTPDGKVGLLFLWRENGLGFEAIKRLGYHVAKDSEFRRIEKPSAKPSRFLLQVSEANSQDRSSRSD